MDESFDKIERFNLLINNDTMVQYDESRDESPLVFVKPVYLNYEHVSFFKDLLVNISSDEAYLEYREEIIQLVARFSDIIKDFNFDIETYKSIINSINK